MRLPVLSELGLRICIYSQESVELYQNANTRTSIVTAALTSAGELSNANYDRAITYKHIQSLAYDSDLFNQEAPVETEISSGATKVTNDVLDSSKKNKKIGKLRRIMIVDDEQDVTFLFKIILEDVHHDPTFSCKVDSFNDSLVALENYKEGLYDLIIIDIVMPKMDGFKLYTELRKKDKNMKACFLTAGEMYYEEYRKHVFPEISAHRIIRKPISNEELVRTIKGYFET